MSTYVVETRDARATRSVPLQVLAFLGRHVGIVVILLAYLALGGLYSLKTPLFETPGEPWHYRYIQQLASGQGLPPLTSAQDAWAQGEAYQPPFYYLVGALLTHGLVPDPSIVPYERNPFMRGGYFYGYADQDSRLSRDNYLGNENAVLHLAGKETPPLGVSFSVQLLRWVGVLFSALTVLLAYFIIMLLIPKHRFFALGTAALISFNPQFIFLSAAVSNHALATLLSTMALYLSVSVATSPIDEQRTSVTWPSVRLPILIGMVTGLAALTHVTGLATMILVPCAYGVRSLSVSRAQRPRPIWADLWRPTLIAWSVALAISMWWYLRNALSYHDPFGLRAMQAIFNHQLHVPSFKEITFILWNSFSSYWGLFGWLNIPADDLFYTFMRVFYGLGLVGLCIGLARLYWRRKALYSRSWPVFSIVALWGFIIVIILIIWLFISNSPHGFILFPAIASFSFFTFIGLASWIPERQAGFIAVIVIFMYFIFSLMVPFRYIEPAYSLPPRLTLEQVPTTIQDLNVNVGDSLFLLGYDLREDGVEAGKSLHLRLYWLAKKVMERNYVFQVHFLGRQSEPVGDTVTLPAGGNYPTRLWLPGEVLADDYVLPTLPTALTPAAGMLRVAVSTWPGGKYLTFSDVQGRELGDDVEIARVRLYSAREATYQPQQNLQVNLADKVQLVGYDLYPRTPAAGDPWEIVFHWKALSGMSSDYTVFVHLINSAGHRVAQLDEQPLAGGYPTHFWQSGEAIRDPHTLRLPADLRTGDYQLEIGLYRVENGERLPIVGSDLNYVVLGPVRIRGGQ
jgi:hypothetical protein